MLNKVKHPSYATRSLASLRDDELEVPTPSKNIIFSVSFDNKKGPPIKVGRSALSVGIFSELDL